MRHLDTFLRLTLLGSFALLAACSEEGSPAANANSTSTATAGSGAGGGASASSGAGGGGEGAELVVAVGEQGAILHCSEAECVSMPSPVTTELDSVVVLSKDRAYAAGAAGVILAWDGSAWSPMEVPTAKSLLSIASDGSTLFAAGQDGIILRLDGSSWTELASPVSDIPGFWIHAMSFAGPTFGLAVGGTGAGALDGVVLAWNGSAWSVEREGVDQTLDSVAVASPNRAAAGGWATNDEPLNLLTRDAQGAWTGVVDIENRNFVTGVSFASEAMGLAVTDGSFTAGVPPALLAWDGAAWMVEPSDVPLTKVHLLDDQTGYLIGWSDPRGAWVERWSHGARARLPAPDTTTVLWGVHGVRIE